MAVVAPNGPYKIRTTLPSSSLVRLPIPPAREILPRWPATRDRDYQGRPRSPGLAVLLEGLQLWVASPPRSRAEPRYNPDK